MVITTEDLDELDLLREVSLLTDTPNVGQRAGVQYSRRRNQIPGVPKLLAANFLGIHDDTLNDWLRRGILCAVRRRGSPKDFVETDRLIQVRSRLEKLRNAGMTRNLAGALVAELDPAAAHHRGVLAQLEARPEGARTVNLPDSWFDDRPTE